MPKLGHSSLEGLPFPQPDVSRVDAGMEERRSTRIRAITPEPLESIIPFIGSRDI
jgi:hypothetical protein